MGPSKMPSPSDMQGELSSRPVAAAERPRRGSLPELRSAEKKPPTGPRANPLYKTRLCMNFQATGICPYTDKCQFAHGEKELEKWESWRNSHKAADQSRRGSLSSDPHGTDVRSPSDSMDGPLSTPPLGALRYQGVPMNMDEFFDGSPALSSVNSVLDEHMESFPEDSTPVPQRRGRAATFDVTYDNMSQLRDAPTLFARPPIFGSVMRSSLV